MSVKGPDGIAPCSPVDYHIFMVRVSSVHYMFRRALHSLESPVADIVRDADDRLAQVIGKLPSHLQPDEPQTSYTKRRDRIYPWVPWQRVYLTLVLLYHRMVINRTLQSSWLVDRDKHGGPRAICLSSAKEILSIQREWTTPLAKRRQWYDHSFLCLSVYTDFEPFPGIPPFILMQRLRAYCATFKYILLLVLPIVRTCSAIQSPIYHSLNQLVL
jgi:hypothetical protein